MSAIHCDVMTSAREGYGESLVARRALKIYERRHDKDEYSIDSMLRGNCFDNFDLLLQY